MNSTAVRPDLAEMELAELEQFLAGLGEERFHAKQVFQWAYKRGVADFSLMTDLSRNLRSTLDGRLAFSKPSVVGRERSSDGTEKFLLELAEDDAVARTGGERREAGVGAAAQDGL